MSDNRNNGRAAMQKLTYIVKNVNNYQDEPSQKEGEDNDWFERIQLY